MDASAKAAFKADVHAKKTVQMAAQKDMMKKIIKGDKEGAKVAAEALKAATKEVTALLKK
jgi:hypothetical protein